MRISWDKISIPLSDWQLVGPHYYDLSGFNELVDHFSFFSSFCLATAGLVASTSCLLFYLILQQLDEIGLLIFPFSSWENQNTETDGSLLSLSGRKRQERVAFWVQEAFLPEAQPKVFLINRIYVHYYQPARHLSTLTVCLLAWNISDQVKDKNSSNTTLWGLK